MGWFVKSIMSESELKPGKYGCFSIAITGRELKSILA